MSAALPHGTVTFVFTDIAGSTALLKSLGDRYAEVLARHRRIIRHEFGSRGGQELDTQGDSFFFCFQRARDAVAAAVAAQRAIAGEAWSDGADVRVRMSLHTGEPVVGEEGYVGIDVHRAARICAAGHGGQVLLSETTAALVSGALPDGVAKIEIGEVRLKDIDRPERVHQLLIDGLARDFPPLRTEAGEPLDLGSRIERRVEEYVARAIEESLAGSLPGPSREPGDAPGSSPAPEFPRAAKPSPAGQTTRWAAFGLLNLVVLVAAVVVVVLLLRLAF